LLIISSAPLAAGCGASTTTDHPSETNEERPPSPRVAAAGDAEDSAPSVPVSVPLSKTELAQKVFEAVQAHDFERYRQYVVRLEELAAALPHLSEERARELHAQVMATHEMMFEEAYAQGERRGIVWADATFREAQQNGRDERPNIFIVFEHGSEPYSMKMDDCLETERGWVVGDYLDAPHHGESRREPVD
jgi:hypothetical protein